MGASVIMNWFVMWNNTVCTDLRSTLPGSLQYKLHRYRVRGDFEDCICIVTAYEYNIVYCMCAYMHVECVYVHTVSMYVYVYICACMCCTFEQFVCICTN